MNTPERKVKSLKCLHAEVCNKETKSQTMNLKDDFSCRISPASTSMPKQTKGPLSSGCDNVI